MAQLWGVVCAQKAGERTLCPAREGAAPPMMLLPLLLLLLLLPAG